jgi:hypothetical protein
LSQHIQQTDGHIHSPLTVEYIQGLLAHGKHHGGDNSGVSRPRKDDIYAGLLFDPRPFKMSLSFPSRLRPFICDFWLASAEPLCRAPVVSSLVLLSAPSPKPAFPKGI